MFKIITNSKGRRWEIGLRFHTHFFMESSHSPEEASVKLTRNVCTSTYHTSMFLSPPSSAYQICPNTNTKTCQPYLWLWGSHQHPEQSELVEGCHQFSATWWTVLAHLHHNRKILLCHQFQQQCLKPREFQESICVLQVMPELQTKWSYKQHRGTY